MNGTAGPRAELISVAPGQVRGMERGGAWARHGESGRVPHPGLLLAVSLGTAAVVAWQSPIAALLVAVAGIVASFAPIWVVTLLPVSAAATLPLVHVADTHADNWVIAGIILPGAIRWLFMGRRLGLWAGVAAAGLVLLMISAVASAAANDPGDALFSVRLASLLLLLLLACSLSAREATLATRGIVATACLVGITVLLGRFTSVDFAADFTDPEGGSFRSGGILGHPSFAGYFTGLALLPLLARGDLLPPRWRIATGVLLLASLGAADSRSAIICVVVGVAFFVPLLGLRLPLVVGVGTIVFLALAPSVISRFKYLFDSGGLDGANSSGWRLDHWSDVLTLVPDFPVFGVGWNQTEELMGGYAVHNGYLQAYVELGIVGAAGLLILFTGAFAQGGRSWRFGGLAVPAFMAMATLPDPGILYPILGYTSILLIFAQAPARLLLSTSKGNESSESDGPRTEPDYFERTHHGSFWRSRGDQPLLYRRRVRTLAAATSGRRLLDVGSGEGFFAERAMRHGFHVTGVDYLAEGVQRSVARIGAARVTYGSATELPFADNSFDVLTAWDVLEHLPDPARALEEFHRVLRPDGVLAASTPNPEARSVQCRGRGSIQFSDATHVSILPATDWHRLLVEYGFRVETMGGDGWWDPPYRPAWLPGVCWTASTQVMFATRYAWPVSSGENTIFLSRVIAPGDSGGPGQPTAIS